MKKFLIISCLTPSAVQSALRKKLFGLCLQSLRNQTWPHWNAILIGEEEREEERIRWVKTDAVYKRDKLRVAVDILRNLREKPDYVLRLDDDDLLAPTALERAASLDFDCYADKYHAYYDLIGNKISLKKFPWLPNTTIHQYIHAISGKEYDTSILFTSNHSRCWHVYYRDKKVLYSPKTRPIYLRIFSPATMSLAGEKNVSASKALFMEQLHVYKRKIKETGRWKYNLPEEFRRYSSDLQSIRQMLPGLNDSAIQHQRNNRFPF